ncbi:MAG TPA: LysR family transcriptional regulator [Candidatus Acidoferrales bacterium]|nr:LysR family transcriptional regulator [Candidatus Acidoferrales bacterium]
MELRQLRSLVTISEVGSISLAAERLCLSPPAIHKQLKILESDLGLPLYEKIGRRLQLTPPAVVLLPYFKDMLAQYDSAFSALQEWKGVKRGLLRIGTGPSVYVLPAILKEFRHAHPHIEVFVETGNTPVLLEDLTKGSLDLVLVVSPDLTEQQDYYVELTWDFEMVLVSHLRRPPRRPHLAQLKKSPFILFRKGSRMQEPIDRYFAKHGFNPKVSMRLDSSELIKRMVRAGFGIAMLPRWVVDSEIKDGSLTVVHQAEPPLYSKLALVRRKLGYVPKPVSAFVDTAKALDAARLRLLMLHKEGAVSSRTPAQSA